ncbi:MAG: hypothetical protein RXN77_00500 [Sulfolobaceae archaeon]|nr:hypothetical protein [Sulfolobales archaeon]
MRWLGSLLLATGVAFLGISLVTFSVPYSYTYSFNKAFTVEVPNFVQLSELKVYVNSTNVTGYVEVIEPDGLSHVSELPADLYLYSGNWTVKLLYERYVTERFEVVNYTVSNHCANVTTQKVIKVPEVVNSTRAVINATAELKVLQAYAVGNPEAFKALGFALTLLGALTYTAGYLKGKR